MYEFFGNAIIIVGILYGIYWGIKSIVTRRIRFSLGQIAVSNHPLLHNKTTYRGIVAVIWGIIILIASIIVLVEVYIPFIIK